MTRRRDLAVKLPQRICSHAPAAPSAEAVPGNVLALYAAVQDGQPAFMGPKLHRKTVRLAPILRCDVHRAAAHLPRQRHSGPATHAATHASRSSRDGTAQH